MAGLDQVPFKIPLGPLDQAKDQVDLITAPEISIPDYLTILQETEYDCRLEKWVLTGLQDGYPGPPRPPAPRCPSDALPSCPPYWQMFSRPPESPRSSAFWDAGARRRSRSLNAWEGGGGGLEEEARSPGGGSGSGSDPAGPADAPSPPGPAPRRWRNQRPAAFRQASLSALDTARGGRQKTPRPPGPDLPRPRSSLRPPTARADTVAWTPPARPAQPSLRPTPGPPPPPSLTPGPAGSQAGAPDASAELGASLGPEERGLLGALGPEERGLLEAVTQRGYPLQSAITALQKTGQQSPEKILGYLEACEHLCGRGYDEAQVQEALEMFHNSETKAAEFLHLLARFHEMGFQQSVIKEVLLVHENHGERALDELMMRVA